MKYVDNYQGMEVSFWEALPLFKEVQPFKKLYKEDRSKDKSRSSKAMWYCTLIKDVDSEFYKMDRSEQDENLFDMAGFDIREYMKERSIHLEELLDEFENFIDTPLSADVRAQEAKLKERQKFIKKTPYTLDELVYPQRENEEGEMEPIPGSKPMLVKGTAAQLDKMVTETKKIHDEIRSLRESLRSEQTEKGKGGKEASFLE